MSSQPTRTRIIRGSKFFLLGFVIILVICDILSVSINMTRLEPVKIRFFQSYDTPRKSVVYRTEANQLFPFTQVKNHKLYLYSAIWRTKLTQTKSTQNARTIALNVWEHKSTRTMQHQCCFLMSNGSIKIADTFMKNQWQYLTSNILQAKQYLCTTRLNHNDIVSVSVAMENTTCSQNASDYIEPIILPDDNATANQIAACTKLAYGALDAERLIEWLEAHRLMGVDKVLAYVYKLNPRAMRVFRHYERMGFVDIYPFELPNSTSKREVGTKNIQAWNDEQVVVFDCVERLQNYKFLALVDTDEYVLPATSNFTNAWKKYLNKMLSAVPKLAGFLFHVKIHVINWKATNKDHPLFIGRFSNTTAPMLDREKGIFMPSRVDIGRVYTHNFQPLPGYKKLYPKAASIVIHHYRSCRKEWLNKRKLTNLTQNNLINAVNSTKCFDFRQYRDNTLEVLAKSIMNRVYQTKCAIGFWKNETTKLP